MIVVATGVVVAIVVAVSFLAVLSWKYYKRQHTVEQSWKQTHIRYASSTLF